MCRARGIFIGKYSSENDAMFAMAEHNDHVRGRLQQLQKENHQLRARYDDELDHRARLQERMPRARRMSMHTMPRFRFVCCVFACRCFHCLTLHDICSHGCRHVH